MKRIETIAAWLFGLGFTGLGLAVAVETVLRKFFDHSLQGVDELGGYVLAVGAGLAFTVALIGRSHVRIDLVHERFPFAARVALNLVSVLTLMLCAWALLAMAWTSLGDTLAMQSTAQTPWATPLKYPQAVWIGALALFALVSTVFASRVLILLVTGRSGVIDRADGPKSSGEELAEEIADLEKRRSAS